MESFGNKREIGNVIEEVPETVERKEVGDLCLRSSCEGVTLE